MSLRLSGGSKPCYPFSVHKLNALPKPAAVTLYRGRICYRVLIALSMSDGNILVNSNTPFVRPGVISYRAVSIPQHSPQIGPILLRVRQNHDFLAAGADPALHNSGTMPERAVNQRPKAFRSRRLFSSQPSHAFQADIVISNFGHCDLFVICFFAIWNFPGSLNVSDTLIPGGRRLGCTFNLKSYSSFDPAP
ncbi:MAG: hypothetical protein WAK95_14670 [Desulfobacterales bacterium]